MVSENLNDIVFLFDNKFRMVFDDKNSQSTTDINNIPLVSENLPVKNIDSAIENLNIGICWDMVHSNHLKYSGKLCR